MTNNTQIDTSPSDMDEVVQIMLRISDAIGRSSWIAHVRGEPYDLTARFETAICDLTLSEQQMIDLWAMFMLAAQATRKAHRHKVNEAR